MIRLELIIFDMDEVLCRYDRPLRLRRLAAMSARTPEEIFAAIWQSGFEASSEAGEMDAEAYLAGFARRIGYPLSRAQCVEARRLAMTPLADVLALVGGIKQTIRRNDPHPVEQRVGADRASGELQDGRERPDQDHLHGTKPHREPQGLRIDLSIKLADTGLKPLLRRQ